MGRMPISWCRGSVGGWCRSRIAAFGAVRRSLRGPPGRRIIRALRRYVHLAQSRLQIELPRGWRALSAERTRFVMMWTWSLPEEVMIRR